MIHNQPRIGNFTSSEIAALMTNGRSEGELGKPAQTYIREKNMERKLGRSLQSENNAHATSWGKLVENRVFELLGLEYQLVSQETLLHPKFKCWAGSPDANKFDKEKTVVDIKSPLTLKSFCDLVEPLYGDTPQHTMDIIRDSHPDGERYYWQLVSNAILTNCNWGELIVYVPYFSELQAIRDLASSLDDQKSFKYYWVANAHDDELPYLIEGGFYKNLNIIRFEIPELDKKELTNRVKLCSKMLI